MKLTFNFAPPDNPTSGVYCIRNAITKKMYVGSSKRLEKRRKAHWYALRCNKHHSVLLQRAWNKYGARAFEFFVLGYYPDTELFTEEQWWLDNSTCAYNISTQANRPTMTDEQRKATAKKCKSLWDSPSKRAAAAERTRKAWAAGVHANTAPKYTAESVAKIKAAHRTKNRNLLAFGKLWCLRELAEEYDVHYGMLKDRVSAGWEIERAVTTPKRKRGL